jgi:TolA-binding protein
LKTDTLQTDTLQADTLQTDTLQTDTLQADKRCVMRRLGYAVLGVLAACNLAAKLRAQSFDQVLPLRGTPTNGRILSTSPTEVVVESRGSQQRLAVNEIKRVSFGDEPQELRRARDQILSGQLEGGLANLKKVDASALQRPEIRQDLQFYLALCEGRLALTGGGDKTAAAGAMLNFVRDYPNSFHFFEAAELLGDLAVALESYDNASKYFGAIASKAPWPDYKMQAAIREARALAAQNKHAEAQAKFEQVMAFEVDTPLALRQKRLAEVGRAACLAAGGQPEPAKQALLDLIAKNDPQDTELFGRAYNALGLAHQQANEPQEALLAYLHTDTLFYQDPEIHAEALYQLSKLWASLQKTERAASARSMLTDRYAGSKWAKLE